MHFIAICLIQWTCSEHSICVLFVRWMDGNFGDLNSDILETESDEYMKEVYKIQKSFNSKLKKMMMEQEDRLREKAKKKRRKTELMELLEGPDTTAPKEEEEPKLVAPAAISVCTQVMQEIQSFKVSGENFKCIEIILQ